MAGFIRADGAAVPLATAATFHETVYLRSFAAIAASLSTEEPLAILVWWAHLGADVHFHATAAGKAMAAALPDATRTSLLTRLPLPRLTPRTIISRSRVNAEWARVRRTGVAVNREETITGAVFLAVPLFDTRRQVCGAISIGIPKARFSATLGRAITAAIKDTVARLSKNACVGRLRSPPLSSGPMRPAADPVLPTIDAGFEHDAVRPEDDAPR